MTRDVFNFPRGGLGRIWTLTETSRGFNYRILTYSSTILMLNSASVGVVDLLRG